jgi:aryl-alcohol dehydrogenase-like predicted oxidoreductase
VRTRALGETGITISELTLGTWGLSGEAYGPVEPIERDRVIDRALELGIIAFETADVYGRGDVERRLGERLAGKPARIITKVGTLRSDPSAVAPGYEQSHKRFEREYLLEAVQRSQERLRCEQVDVVLLHNPSLSTISRGEATAALEELKAIGTIGAWGVSAGDAAIARASLGQRAEVIEVAYNLFFSRDLHELAADLADGKAGVLARSVLSYGLLAGQFAPGHVFESGDHRADRWTRAELETRIKHLDAVRWMVQGQVYTLRAAAVRYVLANSVVSTAVLGPKNVLQLEQLVRETEAAPPYLPDDTLARIPRELAQAGVPA